MKARHLLIVVLLVMACGCGESNPYLARARLGIQNLDKAVSAYKATNADWPQELQSLTEKQSDGGEPYLTANSLVDPWGRPFQYDRNNCHPDTQQPLIWSEGPNPGVAGSKIANWSLKDESTVK